LPRARSSVWSFTLLLFRSMIEKGNGGSVELIR
jgi:hypothetical protein